MQKNELYRNNNSIIRVLEIKNNAVLVIDCINKTMPQWIGVSFFEDWTKCSDETLHEITGIELQDIKTVSPEDFKVAHQRYTMIAPIIMVLTDQDKKNEMIELISTNEKISKQTLRKYLCLYLIYQNISVLIPKTKNTDKQLSQDEKNIRWALNKFYFSFYKHSLKTAYTMMLKAKYCDINGELISTYPTFHQFRYFYRKYKTKQTCYISRNGLTNYQRNNRPLLGDGIQEFAKAPGVGMLDSSSHFFFSRNSDTENHKDLFCKSHTLCHTSFRSNSFVSITIICCIIDMLDSKISNSSHTGRTWTRNTNS